METPETVASNSPESTHIRAEGRANVNNFRVTDRTGLVIALLALILAAGTSGALIVMLSAMSALVDAKVQAGTAKSEALANQARVDARVSLDKIQELRVELAKRKP